MFFILIVRVFVLPNMLTEKHMCIVTMSELLLSMTPYDCPSQIKSMTTQQERNLERHQTWNKVWIQVATTLKLHRSLCLFDTTTSSNFEATKQQSDTSSLKKGYHQILDSTTIAIQAYNLERLLISLQKHTCFKWTVAYQVFFTCNKEKVKLCWTLLCILGLIHWV